MFMPMPEEPPAASTVPPEIVILPSASRGWLSAVFAVHTVVLPPDIVSVPLESMPSPEEDSMYSVPPYMLSEKP